MTDRDHDPSARSDTLPALIAAAQRRWGERALRRGADGGRDRAFLSTGMAALDATLNGGLPRGALTELLGAPTSGMTTIALATIAHTQAGGELAAYVDLGGTFDAAYAAACGIDLANLLLARPASAREALELIEALVTSGGLAVLVVDSLAWLPAAPDGHATLSAALRRLAPLLVRTPTALVALTFLPYPTAVGDHLAGRGSPLANAATLRLHVARDAWEVAPASVLRCQTDVLVLKRRGAPDGGRVRLPITFPGDWGAL